MKKLLKNMKTALGNIARKLHAALLMKRGTIRMKLAEGDGEFVMNNGVVFVLVIVVGGIVLGLLTVFLQTDLAPTLKTKIMDFFN